MKFLCWFKHDWEWIREPETSCNPNAALFGWIFSLFGPKKYICKRCGKEKVV